eukprot:NODE_956_length_2911_cov_0.422475.p2 type:complete len:272 gc:universal NODE_956_length_2911_cov_0.422475:1550-735(-)
MFFHLIFAKIIHDFTQQTTTKSEYLSDNDDIVKLAVLCNEINMLNELKNNKDEHMIQLISSDSDCNKNHPTHAKYSMKMYKLDASTKKFDIYGILDFMRQILSALNYLHSLNPPMAHRDVKPQNIFGEMVNGKMHWVLGDYGFAKFGKVNEKQVMVSDFIGTEAFMAPEMRHNHVIRGNRYKLSEYDAIKADIFALGITFLEIIGQFLFKRYERPRCFYSYNNKQNLLNEVDAGPFNLLTLQRISNLMRQCVSSKRPTAAELLKLKIFQIK